MILKIKNIFKKINNQSEAEKQQLSSWNDEQYENLRVMLQSNSLDEKISSLQGYNFYDKKKAFEKITGEAYNTDAKIIKTSFYKYAAAASVLLIMAFTLFYFTETFKTGIITYASLQTQKETVLKDNSFVNLDVNTKLTYNSNREVSLKGRAYFEVTKNPDQPFVINTTKGKVTVLGTKFTVWSDENNIEVAVQEGRVKYEFDGRSIILEANQWMKLVNNDIVSSSIISKNQFSWQQHSLSFKDTPIDVVLNDISRHYGITVKLSNTIKKKPKCLLTSSYKNENIEQVLLELKTLFDISVVKRSNEYVITAINC